MIRANRKIVTRCLCLCPTTSSTSCSLIHTTASNSTSTSTTPLPPTTTSSSSRRRPTSGSPSPPSTLTVVTNVTKRNAHYAPASQQPQPPWTIPIPKPSDEVVHGTRDILAAEAEAGGENEKIGKKNGGKGGGGGGGGESLGLGRGGDLNPIPSTTSQTTDSLSSKSKPPTSSPSSPSSPSPSTSPSSKSNQPQSLSGPTPTPSPTTEQINLPTLPYHLDSSYLARYRDPSAHDRDIFGGKRLRWANQNVSNVGAGNQGLQKRHQSEVLRQTETTTAAAAAAGGSKTGGGGGGMRGDEEGPIEPDSPRFNRISMERLWEGQENSTPSTPHTTTTTEFPPSFILPTQDAPISRSADGSVPPLSPTVMLELGLMLERQRMERKVALLFPGSGSQYVGMGQFLLEGGWRGAREVWEEAEDALATFDEWKATLDLEAEMEEKLGIKLDLEQSLAAPASRESDRKSLRDVVFGGPQDQLTLSTNAQPSILITSLCLLRVLKEEFGTDAAKMADYFAGHSSGEYSACVASGAISLAQGVRLTRLHGLLTSRTLRLYGLKTYTTLDAPMEERSQMSALVIKPGHTHEEVREVVNGIKLSRGTSYGENGVPFGEGMVEVASFNSSAQVVLAGSRAGVLLASDILKSKGIAVRAADLPVAAPFHTSLMKPAAEGMRIALNKTEFNAPSSPIVSGVNANLLTTPGVIKDHLISQISQPVYWSSALETLRLSGVNQMVFMGPGRALANLLKKEGQAKGWNVREAGEENGSRSKADSQRVSGLGTGVIGLRNRGGGGGASGGGLRLRNRSEVADESTPMTGGNGKKDRHGDGEEEDELVVGSVATYEDLQRVKGMLEEVADVRTSRKDGDERSSVMGLQ